MATDSKKYWTAAAASSAIFAAGSVAWYAVLMRNFYRAQHSRGVLRRRPNYALNALSRAAYGLLFAWAYPRVTNHGPSSIRNGARYGAWAGSLQATPQILVRTANMRVKLPAAATAIAFETLMGTLAGMAVSAIYNSGQDSGIYRGHHPGMEPLPVEDQETAERAPLRGFEGVPVAAGEGPMQPPTGAPSEAEVAV